MADIIQQKTPAAILAELNADTAVYVLEQTGETLEMTNADGAALNNEANAGYYSGLLAEVEGDVQNLLPSPTSSHLDDMVGLIGVERKDGETNQALWNRRADVLQQASLASDDAVERLALSVDGVAHYAYGRVNRTVGGVNTRIDQAYTVSSQAPEASALEGVPSAALRAAVEAVLNRSDAKHVGDVFECPAVTANAFGIYAVVYYDAEANPDLVALQTAVSLAARNWVVASRRLGEKVSLFGFYKALGAVAGVADVNGDFYTGALGTSPQEELAGVANQFHSCAATVNVVDAIGEGTDGQINLTYTAI